MLAHLLEELEDLTAGFGGSASDCATTPLVTPPDDERDGGGGEGGGARDNGGARSAGGGGEKKGLLVEAEEFVRWSHRTGELQNVPPLESVDLPGEKGFTEGCLKVRVVVSGSCAACVWCFDPKLGEMLEHRRGSTVPP